MSHWTQEDRKITSWVFAILGWASILMGLLFLFFSHLQQSHYERWKAAPVVQETGELRTLPNKDVVLVAIIDPETPTEEHRLALYEYWEYRSHYENGEEEKEWEHIPALDHKPDLTLLFNKQPVVVQSQDASLHKTTEVRQSRNIELKGLSPGQEVTVLGQVGSPQDPPTIEADIICGGGREGCLRGFSQLSSIFRVIGFVLLALGIGSVVGRIWWARK